MRPLQMRALIVALMIPLASLGGERPGASGDWPQWRGPMRNGISTDTGLLKEWPEDGPKLLWDSKKIGDGKSVGNGYASLAIAQGKIFTMGDERAKDKDDVAPEGKGKKKAGGKGDEFVYCLDADTGKHVWKTKIGLSFFHNNGSGARCTPTVDGNRLYVISPQGLLVCLEAGDGSILWQKDLVKEFGGKMMSGWGFSESPTVDGEKVVVTPGGKKAAVVALDKVTGAVIWMCEPPIDAGAGYATIAFADVGGIKQYVTQLGKDLGLVGIDAKTGKFLWSYDKVAAGIAHIATPIVKDDYVFTSNAYKGGSALVKLVPDGKGGIQPEEQWILTHKQLENHHGGAVMIGDYIYGGHGQNQGAPFCLEWKTGKFAWGPEKTLGYRSASVLAADGKLYFRYEGGTMALVEASPKALTVKGMFDANIANENWAHPVIWHGKLYLRGDDRIQCYDLKR